MDKKLFAIAGLPRSGSTLLMNILNQNPDITVGPDSSLSGILESSRVFLHNSVKAVQLPHKKFEELGIKFCRDGAEGWINEICPTSIFIDKNRQWFYQYNFNFKVFPDLKIIVCLRDLRYVVESFFKRMNTSLAADFRSIIYTDLRANFMHVSINYILQQQSLREALVSLREVEEINPRFKSRLYFLKYENLIQNKQEELDKIYDFLGIEKHTHDLSNITQYEPHYDNMYQPFGDHNIQSSIPEKFDPKFEYLTEWGQEFVLQDSRWFFEMFYPEVLAT